MTRDNVIRILTNLTCMFMWTTSLYGFLNLSYCLQAVLFDSSSSFALFEGFLPSLFGSDSPINVPDEQQTGECKKGARNRALKENAERTCAAHQRLAERHFKGRADNHGENERGNIEFKFPEEVTQNSAGK